MVSKAAISILLLRAIALKNSLITIILLATSHFLEPFPPFSVEFQNTITFRYVMAAAVISLVYSMVQLPFAASYALNHRRLIPQQFEFYPDMVMSVLLATSSGAGIAVCYEMKITLFDYYINTGSDISTGSHIGTSNHSDDDDLFGHRMMNPTASDWNLAKAINSSSNFLNKILAASVFLLLAWICLAIISIISYNTEKPTLYQHHQSNNTLELPPTELAQHTDNVTIDQDVKASSNGACAHV